MTPGSSTSGGTHCAGSTPNGWCTSWDTFTDQHRAAQARVRGRIWRFYASLKAYQRNPTERRSVAVRARFERIFLRRTGFVTVDRLRARLHANKDEPDYAPSSAIAASTSACKSTI